MPKYAYRNVSDTFLHAFSAIWQHIKALTLHKITFIAVRPWSHQGGPTHKSNEFTQPQSHKEFGFSFQNLKFY